MLAPGPTFCRDIEQHSCQKLGKGLQVVPAYVFRGTRRLRRKAIEADEHDIGVTLRANSATIARPGTPLRKG
jgi:hypothetical protein